jgi:hypothetical protein
MKTKVETVDRFNFQLKKTGIVLLMGLWALTQAAAPVQAEGQVPYVKLQVLVPGEEPAPYTQTGKVGSPLAQTVGVPFQVRVRACTANWETQPGVTNLINTSSTDDQATLPPNTPLNDGEMTTWVTLNSVGDFTVTARDLSHLQQLSDTSPLIRVEAPETGASQLVISPLGSQQTAGEPVIVTIEARRADGSLDTFQNGPVDLYQITSLGQGVMSPEAVSLSGGQWTGNVTFFLADPAVTATGSVRLKAVMPDQQLEGLSNYFNVGPGPYARLLVITPGQSWTPWILDGITGDPVQQWADGPFPVDVYATDEYWNLVAVNDVVKIESGDVEASTPVTGSLNGGHRTFDINLRTPGSWFLAVSDQDQDQIGGMVSREIPVWYSHLVLLLPGEEPAPGAPGGKTGQPLPQVAGIPFPVKVQACNADFEPVPTDDVVVRLSSTDYTATLPEAMPTQDGVLITELTFNSSGSFTVTAEDITGPEYYSTTSGVVTVSGSTGVVTALQIDPIDTYQTAGQPVPVTIRAVDLDGAQVHTFYGAADLVQMTSGGPCSLEPAQIDLSAGQWTGNVTFHLADQSTQPGGQGNVQLKAATGLDGGVTGASNYFQVAPGPLSRVVIVLPGQYLVPATEGGLLGGAATQAAGFPFPVEIYAADQYWNRVASGHSVRITSMDGNASTPVDASLNEGHVSVPVTLGSVGNWTLTVQDLTDPTVAPMTTVPVSVLSSSPDFVIEPLASPVTAGVPVPVTIRTNDPEGNLLEGFNGFAMLAADTGPQTIQPANIQFSGGVWSGEVTFFGAAEELAFSCIDFASPPNIGTSDIFQVLPGDFAGLQVLLPGQENVGGRDPGHTGSPVEQEAGIGFNVIVQAVDAWWNPVPGPSASIDLGLTDPFALVPEQTQLTDGRLELEATFLRAGQHTVTASCDSAGIAEYTSENFDVRPGPYTSIIALVPGEELLSGSELGKAGLPVDQSISHPFTMRVLATDTWWNPVTGIYDELELVCTDPLAEVVQTFSLVDGQAEVPIQLATAGWQLMTLTNLSNPQVPAAHTQTRAIETGFHIEAQVNPEQVVAGQPFTLSVRVVNDAGAVMQDVNGFAQVSVLNATTGEPGQGELLNAEFQFYQGVRSIEQTYTRNEPIVLLVSSPLASEPGLTGVLTVVPGEPASLTFYETEEWVGGRQSTDINAKVADELGNGVPDVPVNFQLTGGGGTLEILNDITDQEGLAKAVYTGTFHGDTGFISVASAGFSASMQIMTSLMDPTDNAGTISNGPNPFHPGDGPTNIWYNLANDAQVTMRLFTLSGTLVLKREYAAGENGGAMGVNEVTWDGRNGEGEYVASGGYILYVEAERLGETIHKMRRRIAVVR